MKKRFMQLRIVFFRLFAHSFSQGKYLHMNG